MPNLKTDKLKPQNTENQLIQNIPSSFHINPDFFNTRLCRLKQKIDKIISQHTSSGLQPDDKSVTRSGSSNYSNYRITTFEQIPIQKFDQKFIYYVRNIYKQIYQLKANVNKDQDQVQTNTFQLRSFLKDLQNQEKRLLRVVPEIMIGEIQCDKKKIIMRSQIERIQENNENDDDKGSIQKMEDEDKRNRKEKESEMIKQIKQNVIQENLQEKVEKQIQKNFNRRKIFNQKQMFVVDEEIKCKGCQIY